MKEREWLKWAPVAGWPQRLIINATAALCLAAAIAPASAQPHAPLGYHGGPVLGTFEIYPLYYGNWKAQDIAAQQQYLQGLTGFISGQDSPPGMQPVMAQYGVRSASVAPAATTSQPSFSTTALQDSDVLKIIHTNQASGKLPGYQPNRLLMVFLPHGYTMPFLSPSCAYHSAESSSAFYSAVPQDCALQLVTAHEVFEAAADPQVGAGWDEAVDGCTSIVNLEFGAIPGPADNTQGGTCSTTGFIGNLQYQGVSGQTQVWARTPTHLDVFWIDQNGGVITNWWDAAVNNGAWNKPFAIAPAGSAAPGTVTVVARMPNHLDVFWVGYDGSVMTNWWDQNVNNGAWNTPFAISRPHSALPSKIAVVARAANQLDVFWIAPDGSVVTNWWDGFHNQWGPSLELAGPGSALPGMIAAVNRMPGQLDVFWIDRNGGVITNFWNANFNNGRWNTPFPIAPANSALAGAITAVSQNPNHLDVFWIGPDQSVRSNYWDASATWGTPYTIAGPNSALPGAISAVARINAHLDVFWVSPNQQVMTNWWDASTNWAQPFPVSGLGQGRPSELSVVARQPQQLDVFSVDWDGSVMTAFWNPAANWVAPFPIAGPGSALAPDFTQPPRPGNWAEVRDTGLIEVYWGGADGSAMTGSDNGPTITGPFSMAPAGSVPAFAPITGVSRQEHHTDAYWISTGGVVMLQTSDAFVNDFNWSAANQVAFAASPGVPVAAVSPNPNHIDLFWADRFGAVVTTSWDQFANNGQFTNPQEIAVAGKAKPNSPVAAATRNANHVDVFWADSNGVIWTAQWDASSGWASPQQITTAGAAPAGAPITPVTRNAYHVDIYWVDKLGAVKLAYNDQFTANAQWQGPFAIAPNGSSVAGTSVAAVSRVPYQVDLFWQTSQGAIMSTLWSQFFNNGNWITPYQVAPAGQAEANSPLAAVCRNANDIDVFWMPSNGSVSTVSWSAFANNGQWTAPRSLTPPGGGNGGGSGSGSGGHGGGIIPAHPF